MLSLLIERKNASLPKGIFKNVNLKNQVVFLPFRAVIA